MVVLPSAAAARLDALAARHTLDGALRDRLGGLLLLLARTEHASTTVRDPVAAVDVHVADALVALGRPELDAAGRLADLGAGAGFPGLVLAIARPALEVVLVESVARRLAFPALVRDALELSNVDLVAERAEAWAAGGGREACDVVTVRAVAPLAVLAEYAAPLLRPGGSLIAWKGTLTAAEHADADAACAILGLAPTTVRPVTPWPGARARQLVTSEKVAPTPSRFPRRPGVARKRPLGAAGSR